MMLPSRFYFKNILIFFSLLLILSLSNSCGKDIDLFEIVSEEQVDEVAESDDETEESDDETEESDDDSDSQEEEENSEEEDEDDDDSGTTGNGQKINIIFDTDTNNELDDQHALAYLLSNGDFFNLEAVTVNATQLGGDIDGHFEEALRILKLYNLEDKIAVYKGANGEFEDIEQNWNPNNFDGIAAADTMIEKTLEKEILIVAVGKLTNVALALRKDPSMASRTKVIWLGSNYPNSGEYNQENDLSSVNFVIESGVPLEIVTVRLGGSLPGSAEVFTSVTEIRDKMPGLGPQASSPVTGRDGGTFSYFGDYSVDLFNNIGKEFRSLFDLVALSILKNPEWGAKETIPAPILQNGNWVNRPGNSREISIWGDFDRDGILEDFFESIENYSLVE